MRCRSDLFGKNSFEVHLRGSRSVLPPQTPAVVESVTAVPTSFRSRALAVTCRLDTNLARCLGDEEASHHQHVAAAMTRATQRGGYGPKATCEKMSGTSSGAALVLSRTTGTSLIAPTKMPIVIVPCVSRPTSRHQARVGSFAGLLLAAAETRLDGSVAGSGAGRIGVVGAKEAGRLGLVSGVQDGRLWGRTKSSRKKRSEEHRRSRGERRWLRIDGNLELVWPSEALDPHQLVCRHALESGFSPAIQNVSNFRYA